MITGRFEASAPRTMASACSSWMTLNAPSAPPPHGQPLRTYSIVASGIGRLLHPLARARAGSDPRERSLRHTTAQFPLRSCADRPSWGAGGHMAPETRGGRRGWLLHRWELRPPPRSTLNLSAGLGG